MIKENAAAKASGYRVPALEKGLDVLERLSDEMAGLTLSELAERLGRTSQELFRMLACLVERGYLVRDEAQRFRLSTKLFHLGSKQASIHALVARAFPHMQQLAAKIDEPCHLSIRVHDKMIVVARAESTADVRLAVRVGAIFALHERVSGRTALAFLADEQRQAYWKQTPLGKREVADVEQELAEIRERGGEAASSPITVGAQDFAAPVLGPGGSLLGVLCVSRLARVGETTRWDFYHQAVMDCAGSISTEFGPAENLPFEPRQEFHAHDTSR